MGRAIIHPSMGHKFRWFGLVKNYIIALDQVFNKGAIGVLSKFLNLLLEEERSGSYLV